MTVKAKITIATIYSIYNDGRASETNDYLFLGNPSKAEVKTKYMGVADNIKKATVCEVERVAIDIEVNADNYDHPFSDILSNALATSDHHVAMTIM